MTKEETIKQFVILLDEMISALQLILDEEPEETRESSMTRRFLNNFIDIRQAALDGRLHSSKGAGMGAGRAMSEFNYNELAELANEIDQFCRTQLF